jgi:hypothetical protein
VRWTASILARSAVSSVIDPYSAANALRASGGRKLQTMLRSTEGSGEAEVTPVDHARQSMVVVDQEVTDVQVPVHEHVGRRRRERLGGVEQDRRLGGMRADAQPLELREPVSRARNAHPRVGPPERIMREIDVCDGGRTAFVQHAQKPTERPRELRACRVVEAGDDHLAPGQKTIPEEGPGIVVSGRTAKDRHRYRQREQRGDSR